MSDLPSSVRDRLAEFAAARRHLAWIECDADGRVAARGGALARQGLDHVRPGDDLSEAVPAIDVLAEHEIPKLELAPGHLTDVLLRPSGDGWSVLAIDSTTSVRRERELLQKGNELALLSERLVDGAQPAHALLQALGLVLLRHTSDGRLCSERALPAWTADLCQKGPAPSDDVRVDDETSFLGNFLVDAAEFWADGAEGVLRSGPWTEERGDDAGELSLEAIAITTERGVQWLVVQRLEAQYEERRDLLQRARETRLDFDDLREEIEKKEVLLHCIVHDLKGPLASIVGALSILRRRTLPPERTQELLELALRQAQRQDENIQQVLEVFAAEVQALEAWEQDPALAPDLVALARDQVARWTPAFEEREQELCFEPAEAGALPVAASASRLERVLGNLLENARRHSPRGSVVHVRVGRAGDHAELAVVDHGTGVDAGVLADLFRRFARGQGGGSAGLGLFFCRTTVERWGGRLRHEPTPGGGATFVAELELLEGR